MRIIFSIHALYKIKERNLSKEQIIETINSPDHQEFTRDDRRLAEKNFGKMNLRVIFCQEDKVITIITAYWHERRKNGNII